MLNLYDYLTPLDSKRIENYVTEWGVEDGYVGNDRYLRYWNESNKKLFHCLGGELIRKFPFSYEKPSYQLSEELRILRTRHSFFNQFFSLWENMREKYSLSDDVFYGIWDIFCEHSIISDNINNSIKFKIPDVKGTLQIQKGMKPVRAMQKVIQYFGMNELMTSFEDFRIAHSMIYNEKEVKGNVCISIHPLDFMTMSDNASDWSSCMSWVEYGCYHVGTVEMMNSNNVVCCYIESKTPFEFGRKHRPEHVGEEWTWNNKKWRQLFYVTKDIIVGGKSYPYSNSEITKQVLEILRGLAQENLGWSYSFGPELYKDMVHVGSLYRMDRNKTWLRTGQSFKHNILFDSKGMYNDMLNAQHFEYWCIRNKVKKMKVISYSGKAPCACCMGDVLDENYDMYYHDEGSYNDRFVNVRNIICESCASDRYCDICGNENGYSKVYKLDGSKICLNCIQEHMRKCPDCGKPFKINYNARGSLIVRHTDETIYLQDIYDLNDYKRVHSTRLMTPIFMCPECKKKMGDKFTSKKVLVDKTRTYHAWDTYDTVSLSNEVYDINDEFVQKHIFSALAIPPVADDLD